MRLIGANVHPGQALVSALMAYVTFVSLKEDRGWALNEILQDCRLGHGPADDCHLALFMDLVPRWRETLRQDAGYRLLEGAWWRQTISLLAKYDEKIMFRQYTPGHGPGECKCEHRRDVRW